MKHSDMRDRALRSLAGCPNIDGVVINSINHNNNKSSKRTSPTAANHVYDINNIILTNSDTDANNYTFNFDKKILNLNDTYINEKNIIFDSESTKADFSNLFKFHADNIADLIDCSDEVQDAKADDDHDVEGSSWHKSKVDQALLKEKKKLKIKEIRIRASRKRNMKIKIQGSKPNKDKKNSILFIKENENDPLCDWNYTKFHKSKLKIEKNFANDDKIKFTEDVSNMSDVFTKLITMLKYDKQYVYKQSLVEVLINSASLDTPEAHQLQVTEFSPDSSLIIAYFNHLFFQNKSPNYSKLLHLLDNQYDYITHTCISGPSNIELSEQSQCNNLKGLVTKSSLYREDFKSLLFNDKGFKEQFEYKHMRSNTSINFKPDYYNDFDNSEEAGKGSVVFNDLHNFCRIIRYGKSDIHESEDKSSNNISLSKDIYSMRFSIKDRLLIKTLQRFTYLNPVILKSLKFEEEESEIFEKNIKNLRKWNKALNYFCHNLLFTLFEMFKTLKFFYGYWVNKNEYINFMRSSEHQKINKRLIPSEENSLKKKQKKQKKAKMVNKFDKFALFNICLSDNENDDGLDETEYSDPDNDISISDLKEKRKIQNKKKAVNDFKMNGPNLDESMQPIMRKIIYKVNDKKRIIFDPRFGTRTFTEED